MEQLDLFAWYEQCREILRSGNIPRQPWTETEIETLHLHLLEQSLKDLRRASSPKIKDEILSWIDRPIVDSPLPFSFQACCWFEQVNAENLRDLIYMEVLGGKTRH